VRACQNFTSLLFDCGSGIFQDPPPSLARPGEIAPVKTRLHSLLFPECGFCYCSRLSVGDERDAVSGFDLVELDPHRVTGLCDHPILAYVRIYSEEANVEPEPAIQEGN
jgi:hypothetical protein